MYLDQKSANTKLDTEITDIPSYFEPSPKLLISNITPHAQGLWVLGEGLSKLTLIYRAD